MLGNCSGQTECAQRFFSALGHRTESLEAFGEPGWEVSFWLGQSHAGLRRMLQHKATVPVRALVEFGDGCALAQCRELRGVWAGASREKGVASVGGSGGAGLQQ